MESGIHRRRLFHQLWQAGLRGFLNQSRRKRHDPLQIQRRDNRRDGLRESRQRLLARMRIRGSWRPYRNKDAHRDRVWHSLRPRANRRCQSKIDAMTSGFAASDRKTVFSDDRVYRFQLWREFQTELEFGGSHQDEGERFVQFIGLNPSTADEVNDDPTIRRCVRLTKAWGYGALCMTNLFAFRATNPRDLMASVDSVGLRNDSHLIDVSKEAAFTICAWGRGGNFNGRGIHVCLILRKAGARLFHLGLNSDLSPKHPLYLPATTKPQAC